MTTSLTMPPAKYKHYYQLMIDKNQDLFDEFQPIHDGFVADKQAWEEQFHQVGRRVTDVIRDWERRLCGHMEKGANSKYSARLADKFHAEIKKRFSHIDLVGVRVKRVTS